MSLTYERIDADHFTGLSGASFDLNKNGLVHGLRLRSDVINSTQILSLWWLGRPGLPGGHSTGNPVVSHGGRQSIPQILKQPGDNPGANRWFLWSTSIQMLPPGGSIGVRLT